MEDERLRDRNSRQSQALTYLSVTDFGAADAQQLPSTRQLVAQLSPAFSLFAGRYLLLFVGIVQDLCVTILTKAQRDSPHATSTAEKPDGRPVFSGLVKRASEAVESTG